MGGPGRARPGPCSESLCLFFNRLSRDPGGEPSGAESSLKPRKFGSTLKRKALGRGGTDREGFWEDRSWGSSFHYWEELGGGRYLALWWAVGGWVGGEGDLGI